MQPAQGSALTKVRTIPRAAASCQPMHAIGAIGGETGLREGADVGRGPLRLHVCIGIQKNQSRTDLQIGRGDHLPGPVLDPHLKLVTRFEH